MKVSERKGKCVSSYTKLAKLDIDCHFKSFRKSKPVVATSMDGIKDDVKHRSKGITQQMMLKSC